MVSQLENMLSRIAHWYHAPTKMVPDVTSEAATFLLPIQVAWTALGLIHYRVCKSWAWKIYQDKLRSRVESRSARLKTLRNSSESIVPGMPDWLFRWDDIDSSITNRATGEELHIDLRRGPGLINAYHFAGYYSSLREPGPAEQRLHEWYPESMGLLVALDFLRNQGMYGFIVPPDDQVEEFTLAGELRKYAKAVEAFLAAWAKPGQNSSSAA